MIDHKWIPALISFGKYDYYKTGWCFTCGSYDKNSHAEILEVKSVPNMVWR